MLNNTATVEPMKLTAKAGDIFVTRSHSKSSFWIQLLTASRWSHVGIAIGDDLILDAVKDACPQVRIVPLREFVAEAAAIRKYTHPGLTTLQASKLATLAKAVKLERYTAVHAALTIAIPFMKLVCSGVAVLSLYGVLRRAAAVNTHWLNVLCSCVIIVAIIYTLYRLMTWSLRTDIGVKVTEATFRKFLLGNYLVKIKHDLFCSKLVLLADKELDGPLNGLVPNESEIQPKHISKACEKLGWALEDFPSCAVAKDLAAH